MTVAPFADVWYWRRIRALKAGRSNSALEFLLNYLQFDFDTPKEEMLELLKKVPMTLLTQQLADEHIATRSERRLPPEEEKMEKEKHQKQLLEQFTDPIDLIDHHLHPEKAGFRLMKYKDLHSFKFDHEYANNRDIWFKYEILALPL